MNRRVILKITDLNPYLSCYLCKGYLIDAATITECLHSFCKSCIVRYVRKNESCPICNLEIMKDKISKFLKKDGNLQYIVYKLVPGLFKTEMQKRRKFYSTDERALKPKYRKKIELLDKEALGDLNEEFLVIDDKKLTQNISISIEYSETGLAEISEAKRIIDLNPSNTKRYLECTASLPIRLLKKFICMKLNSESELTNMDVMYDDKPLKDDLTLIDIAYIFAWRAKLAPMRLFYRVKNKKELVETKIEQVQASVSELKNEKIEDESVKIEINKEELTTRIPTPPTSTQAQPTITSIVEEIYNEKPKILIKNQEAIQQPAKKKIKTEKQVKVKQTKKISDPAKIAKNCENSNNNNDFMKKLQQQQQQMQQHQSNIINAQIKAEKLFTHDSVNSTTMTSQQHAQIKYAAAAAAAAAAVGNSQNNFQFQQLAANFPCIPIFNHLMYAQKMSLAAVAAAKQQQQQNNFNNQQFNNKQIFNETQNFYNFSQNYPLAASTPTPAAGGVDGNSFVNNLNFAASIAVAAASKAAAYNQQYSATNGMDLTTQSSSLRSTTTPEYFSNPLEMYNHNPQQQQQNQQTNNKLNDISSLKETQMRIMESCNLVND